MAPRTVVKSIQNYLHYVSAQGIPVSYGVLYGSYAKGKQNQWSDIDLLVVSSRFDKKIKRADIDLLWHVAADVDSRIEPIAVGEKQYEDSDSSFIIEIARREGQIIPLAE
jgi:predicted nucleotidyltransferase